MLGAFLPERESDFQAFWYFAVILAGVGVLAGIGSWLTAGTIRPLWRAGDRPTAVLIGAVTATTVVLLGAMAILAIAGLAHDPGTGPGRP